MQNNVRLLNEMLDSYKIGISSSEELELINELYQNCQRIKTPSIDKFMKELGWTESQELKSNQEVPQGILGDVLEVREELMSALKKYKQIILRDRNATGLEENNQDTLLHFDVVDAKPFARPHSDDDQESAKSSVDVLCDIFTATNIPDDAEVLQPVTILKNG